MVLTGARSGRVPRPMADGGIGSYVSGAAGARRVPLAVALDRQCDRLTGRRSRCLSTLVAWGSSSVTNRINTGGPARQWHPFQHSGTHISAATDVLDGGAVGS
jgi:hypothetical protein